MKEISAAGKNSPYNDHPSLSSASNYIITGSTGFETAKACAIIEDSRIEENLLLDDNVIATKSGESLCNDDFFSFSPLLKSY